jgi:hypothetical protein
MHRTTLMYVGLALVTLIGNTSHANVLWRGDFLTGDHSQWSEAQSWGPGNTVPGGPTWDPSRIAVVPDPDRPGSFKCHFLVKVGDQAYNTRHNPVVDMNHRSELTHGTLVPDGAERWYGWEQFFPSDFSVTDNHTPSGGATIMQMHNIRPSDGNEDGSPRLLLSAYTDTLQLGGAPALNSSGNWIAMKVPLIKGRWFPIVVHYIFSSDPSVGLAEIWVDGKSVLSIHTMTEFPGYEQYLKMGLYPRPSAVPDINSEVRGVIEATSQADVAEFFSITPPSPTPVPPTTVPPTTGADAGTPEIDAGMPTADAGPLEADAGMAEVDAGTPEADAGTPGLDAGTPGSTMAGSGGEYLPPTGGHAAGVATSPAGSSPEIGMKASASAGCSSFAGDAWLLPALLLGGWSMRRRRVSSK